MEVAEAARSSIVAAARSSIVAAARSSIVAADIIANWVAAALTVVRVMNMSTDIMIMMSAATATIARTRRTGISTDIMIMMSAANATITRRTGLYYSCVVWRYCRMLHWDIHCRMHCS